MLLNNDCTSNEMKMYPGGIFAFFILLTKSYEFFIAYLLLCDFVSIFAMYLVKLYSGPPIVETTGLLQVIFNDILLKLLELSSEIKNKVDIY